MNQNEINTIDLSSIETYEYMSSGVIAQDVSTHTIMNSSPSTVTLNSGISITTTGLAASSGSYTISTPYDDMETRLTRLEKIIAEEEEVRRTHPAVQMAYDEYRLLYILAKKNPGDRLTDL